MNQDRLDRYQSRRALMCLYGTSTAAPAEQASEPETAAATEQASFAPRLDRRVADKVRPAKRAPRSALVQGLCGAAAAALLVAGAMVQDPQNSLMRAENFLQAIVHSWQPAAAVSQAQSEEQTDIAEDPADASPSFPDLHREVSQKLPHRSPAAAASR